MLEKLGLAKCGPYVAFVTVLALLTIILDFAANGNMDVSRASSAFGWIVGITHLIALTCLRMSVRAK
jgi:hypothetical protein